MNIEQVVTASTFRLNVSRDDLEALKVALNQTYHYRNNAIPEHLQGVMSSLMDTVDAAIDKDDEIQRRVRSEP